MDEREELAAIMRREIGDYPCETNFKVAADAILAAGYHRVRTQMVNGEEVIGDFEDDGTGLTSCPMCGHIGPIKSVRADD